MADETPKKDKKDLLNEKFKDFVLDDPQMALILALQDLTKELKIARMRNDR